MKRFIIVLLAVLCVTGVAWGGATTVYPVADTFSGSSTGIAITPIVGNVLGGDTTVLSVASGDTCRVIRIDFKPQADITGTINVLLGSDTIYSIVNALADNVYGMNLTPNFVEGSAGDDIIINSPATTDVYYNIQHRTD